MAVNFSKLVYEPNYDMFARPITITPLASQPGGAAYSNRGIFDTRALDVLAEDGSIFSDQQTILDILEVEFSVLPQQRDQVDIPAVEDIPAEGLFEVVDASSNGGGETTLVIRKVVTAKP
jgi:hypothetical protein